MSRYPGESRKVRFEGLVVTLVRGEDGKIVVYLDGPGDRDLVPDGEPQGGAPDIRIWLNEALLYRSGEIGEDLNAEKCDNCPHYREVGRSCAHCGA